MQQMNETSWNNFGGVTGQGVTSTYQLIVVAALRNKQLVRGASPRISPGPQMHRNTTIALEEVRRGLVPFTMNGAKEKDGKSGEGSGERADSAVASAGFHKKEMR
jgi:DNA-directed RNA polymerase omega subunit